MLLLLLLFCSLSVKNLCHAPASGHLSLNTKLPFYQSHGVIGPWLPLQLPLTSLTRSRLSASKSPLATGSGNQPLDKLARLCSFLFRRRFDQRQLFLPFALTHHFCYRSSVVASLECYQKLEVYDGQQNQHTGKSRIS